LKVTRQLRITKSSEKFTSMEPAQSLTWSYRGPPITTVQSQKMQFMSPEYVSWAPILYSEGHGFKIRTQTRLSWMRFSWFFRSEKCRNNTLNTIISYFLIYPNSFFIRSNHPTVGRHNPTVWANDSVVKQQTNNIHFNSGFP
jgi:hypothetical protein